MQGSEQSTAAKTKDSMANGRLCKKLVQSAVGTDQLFGSCDDGDAPEDLSFSLAFSVPDA